MLKFENVDVSINKTPILKNISLELEEGRITSIIGPNGCGKTTLLQTLNGVSTVTAGRILIDGEDFLALAARERAKRLSFMPQFRDSAPAISVKGLVEHGRFPYMGFSRKMSPQDKEAVEKALKYSSLEEYKNHMVNELSGGLQQRAYLSMQLAQNSTYMVMDEPMTYLDFPGQREMYELINRLGQKGKTLILVLHDLNQALRISDSLIIMKDREIVGKYSPGEALESRVLQEVFNCEIHEVDIKGDSQYVLI